MRSPDGETSFQFVVSKMVYSSYSEEDRREVHDQLIGSWVGTQGICPDGYIVDEPEDTSGAYIYKGECK